MEKTYDTLYVNNRWEWRAWLESNFRTQKEIWLIFPKVSSGKKRLTYNDAVEEALCFGWIDSTVKSYDEQSSIQRFTPRKPKSTYSQSNKERIRQLYEQNLLHPSIVDSVRFIISEIFIFPSDIIEALKKDPVVWANYNNFSASYQRIRIAYIDGARNRPNEFAKRLRNFIEKTKLNKIIDGYGGINQYY